MRYAPLRIGSLTVDVPVFLAPMAGYTDSAHRRICRVQGCGMGFTEVVNAAGIVHGSPQTLHLLMTYPGEHPVGAHIYGADPEVMAGAAVAIGAMNRFDAIDINAGCPVRKIVAKGAGAALMKDPARLARIVRAVVSATSLPVTVKTRLGLSPDRMNIAEVAQAVEEAGASALFLHGRFACHRHAGHADWDAIARIKAARSIPVIGNGDIHCAEDALAMFSRTGVDGVMIGREAVGNPWVFRYIRCLLNREPYRLCSLDERRAAMAEHLAALVALKEAERGSRKKSSVSAEQAAARHFRGHLHRYLHGLKGWGEMRRQMETIRTAADILRMVDLVLAANTTLRHGPGVSDAPSRA